MSLDALRAMLVRHEQLRLKPYVDCCGKPWQLCSCERKGKLTIGVGRNLDDVGVSSEEAFAFLEHDLAQVNDQIASLQLGLSENRTDVLIDMAFNMGLGRLLGFTRLFAALKGRDYERAADEMLASHWAIQVGTRATELAQMMRTDQYLAGSTSLGPPKTSHAGGAETGS